MSVVAHGAGAFGDMPCVFGKRNIAEDAGTIVAAVAQGVDRCVFGGSAVGCVICVQEVFDIGAEDAIGPGAAVVGAMAIRAVDPAGGTARL